MLDVRLQVVGGDAKTTEVRLKRLPTTIGRARDVTLTLPHPLVSRHHCQLFEKDGWLYVRDLGSLNGTFVDNKRLEDDGVLEPDRLLTIGNVTFRAVYEVGRSVSERESTRQSSDETLAAGSPRPAAGPSESADRYAPASHRVIEVSGTTPVGNTKGDTVFNPAANLADRPPDVHRSDTPPPSPPANESLTHGSGSLAGRSVLQALEKLGEEKPVKQASLSALQQLESVAERPQPADSVVSVDIHDEALPHHDPIGQSFLRAINDPEHSDLKQVSEDDPSFDSFIRKIPR